MNFGKALEELKNGNKIAREGWNGKGMYIFKHEGFDTNEVSNITGNKHDNVPPFICMKTADKNVVFGWLANQYACGRLENHKIKNFHIIAVNRV